MEGQVVGRHPEGSGGSPALETLSALMHRRLHDAKMYNWKLHCFGWLDCRAAARYRTLSPHLPGCFSSTMYLCWVVKEAFAQPVHRVTNRRL